MNDSKLFDHYSLRARLFPALVTLLPAALAVFAWTGPGDKGMMVLWTLIGMAGGTYFLGMLSRNQGKRLEPSLWQSWGGAPTTQLLRHIGPANPNMRARWHEKLSRLVGKAFPTRGEEAKDPGSADHLYEAGVKILIAKTRDAKVFPLLYKENVHYGFCRNLYALRPVGIVVAILGLVTSGIASVWFLHAGAPQIAAWVCVAAIIVLLAAWTTLVTSSWVRVPAFAYAERLLESTESLVINGQ